MADKLEMSLRRLEVVSNALEVVRNVYFHEKEQKDNLVNDCISIIEKEVKEIKEQS